MGWRLKQPDERCGLGEAAHSKRRLARLVACLWVGTSEKQQAHDALVTVVSRHEERRIAVPVVVFDIHVLVAEQCLRKLDVAHAACLGKRKAPVTYLIPRANTPEWIDYLRLQTSDAA